MDKRGQRCSSSDGVDSGVAIKYHVILPQELVTKLSWMITVMFLGSLAKGNLLKRSRPEEAASTLFFIFSIQNIPSFSCLLSIGKYKCRFFA